MALIQVHAGDNLQTALNASVAGDRIEADAAAAFTGEFTLPTKSGAVTLTTSATLPGRRLTPSDAALLPLLRSGTSQPPIGGTSSSHWVLDGLNLESTIGGNGAVIYLEVASNIYMDRILLVAGSGGQHRGVLVNGQAITLTRSHIANIWDPGGHDSQAFNAYDGAGPYTITDNYLEAASENILFGGGQSLDVSRNPADILVQGNHCFKPLSWVGAGKNVKNLFEFKNATRATVRQNVFENCWADGQSGTAIAMTPLNDSSSWSVVQDVLFEQNIILNSVGVFVIGGHDGTGDGPVGVGHGSGQATNITIKNNLAYACTGYAFQLNGEIGTLTIDHNTIDQGSHAISLYGGFIWPNDSAVYRQALYAVADFTFSNNLINHNTFGIAGDTNGPFAGGFGTTALDQYCTSYTFLNNVMAGGGAYPLP